MDDYSEINYNHLGGLYFPILQQDGISRQLTKVGNGNSVHDTTFLRYLRDHDRQNMTPDQLFFFGMTFGAIITTIFIKAVGAC